MRAIRNNPNSKTYAPPPKGTTTTTDGSVGTGETSASETPDAPLSLRHELLALLTYYRRHTRLLILDLLAVFFHAGVIVLIPMTTLRIFTVYLVAGDLRRTLFASIFLLVLTVIAACLEWTYIQVGHFLGIRVETEMRNAFFRHIQLLPFTYFDRNKTGDLMSRITSDLMLVGECAHHILEDITEATLTLVGAFTVMFFINPRFALLTLLPIPFIVLFAARFQRGIHASMRRVRTHVSAINSRVENTVQGIREVKSFTNERHEALRFIRVNRSFRTAWDAVYRRYAPFFAGTQLLIESYSLIYIALGAYFVCTDSATLPQVFAFFMYSRYVTQPVRRLIFGLDMYQQGLVGYRRFREIMLEPVEIDTDPIGADPVDPATLTGAITFDHVTFSYPGSPTPVLHDITLQIPAGQTYALIGESGAGKTTFASLIPRFYEPQSGQILIDGLPITSLPKRTLRKLIGTVSQKPFLFDDTIRANVAFGRPSATDDEIIQALTQANLGDFLHELPEGLDTQVGEHGVMLSGGQGQRIAIARVFLKNPKILIFDEATSALDTISEATVQSAMRRLCQGRTTLIIAHRLSTIRSADTICLLDHGKIVEQGTHAQLLARGNYYTRLNQAAGLL